MAYVRKTEDEWQIWGYYCGWDELAAYASREAAITDLKLYRSNEIGTQFKLIKRRVRISKVR